MQNIPVNLEENFLSTTMIAKNYGIKNTKDIITYLEKLGLIFHDKENQVKLTPIEFDIFNILFQNHGTMVSSSKLLQEVWGYSADDDVETIRVHIRHIRSKISKISDNKNLIETIYGGGYKLNV